jgi:hypothetical protein
MLQTGSKLSLDSQHFMVELMGLEMVGTASVHGETSRDGKAPVTSAHIDLASYGVDDASGQTGSVTGEGLTLDAAWQEISLAAPTAPSEVSIELPHTSIGDLRLLNGLLPERAPLELQSGSGTLSAGFEVDETGTASGHLELEADDVVVDSQGSTTRADLALEATLTEGRLDERRFQLAATKLRVDEVVGDETLSDRQQERLRDWFCEVGAERGAVTFGKPMAVSGDFTVTMHDIRPVFALLRKFGKSPKWLSVVPDIKDIDGRFTLDSGPGGMALDDIDITGQGLEVLGWMHVRAKQRNGRIFVKYKGLAAGLGMDDSKSSIHLAAPRKWFDEHQTRAAGNPQSAPGEGPTDN